MNVPIERTSLRQSLVTWGVILKISLEERLVYRGDFILGTMMRFLPIITQIFLWNAVFASAVSESIKGYRFKDVVAYYLLTMLVRAFSSMPGLASGIATQIRNGEIKKFLIQPVDLLGASLLIALTRQRTPRTTCHRLPPCHPHPSPRSSSSQVNSSPSCSARTST